MVADEAVLVAKIGATVAAATGVTVLKIGFCRQNKPLKAHKRVKERMLVARGGLRWPGAPGLLFM